MRNELNNENNKIDIETCLMLIIIIIFSFISIAGIMTVFPPIPILICLSLLNVFILFVALMIGKSTSVHNFINKLIYSRCFR